MIAFAKKNTNFLSPKFTLILIYKTFLSVSCDISFKSQNLLTCTGKVLSYFTVRSSNILRVFAPRNKFTLPQSIRKSDNQLIKEINHQKIHIQMRGKLNQSWNKHKNKKKKKHIPPFLETKNKKGRLGGRGCVLFTQNTG